MDITVKKLLVGAAALFFSAAIFANPCPPGNPPTNCAPPSGPVILDLNGTAVPHTFTHYTTTFTAAQLFTNLSFAFREDPAFLHLDNVTMHAGVAPNLLINGDFESGLTGWTALNTFGATFSGVVNAGCGTGGSHCWFDGSVQGYDGLTQLVATLIGTLYTVEFDLMDDGPLTTFSRLSTNGNTTGTGGNGIDLLVYAGRVPSQVPEPGTLALLGLGLAGLAASRRRKQA